MKKEFVPYEEALALKELGFKGKVIAIYHYKTHELEMLNGTTEGNYGVHIDAPLYQQAFRWFREKYNLDGYVIREQFDYEYRIKLKGETLSHLIKYYLFYEEAELECLRKLIKIVKENG